MKKIIFAAFAMLFALTFTSCGSDEQQVYEHSESFDEAVSATMSRSGLTQVHYEILNIPGDKKVSVWNKTTDALGQVPTADAEKYERILDETTFAIQVWGWYDSETGIYTWTELNWASYQPGHFGVHHGGITQN